MKTPLWKRALIALGITLAVTRLYVLAHYVKPYHVPWPGQHAVRHHVPFSDAQRAGSTG